MPGPTRPCALGSDQVLAFEAGEDAVGKSGGDARLVREVVDPPLALGGAEERLSSDACPAGELDWRLPRDRAGVAAHRAALGPEEQPG